MDMAKAAGGRQSLRSRFHRTAKIVIDPVHLSLARLIDAFADDSSSIIHVRLIMTIRTIMGIVEKITRSINGNK